MGPLCQTDGGPGRRRRSICLASLPAGPERFHLSVTNLDLIHFFICLSCSSQLPVDAQIWTNGWNNSEVKKRLYQEDRKENMQTRFYFIRVISSHLLLVSSIQNTEKILNVGETPSAQKIKKKQRATLNESNDEQYAAKMVPMWLHPENTTKGLSRPLIVLRLRHKGGHGNTTAWAFPT